MALITWNDQYSVGIRKIDDQHKRLVGFINDLHGSMLEGKGKEVMGKILGGLIDYTRTHFLAEESLMSLYRYADFEAHKKEHDGLTGKVLDLQRKFQEGTASMTLDLMTFLKDWLTNHILKLDKKYAPFLIGKGVQ